MKAMYYVWTDLGKTGGIFMKVSRATFEAVICEAEKTLKVVEKEGRYGSEFSYYDTYDEMWKMFAVKHIK